MLTGIEMLNGSLTAATKTLKPISIWGSSLKALVLTHPAAFLVLTGSSIVSVGIYTFTAQKVEKRQKKKSISSSDENLANPTETLDSTVEKKETSWSLFKAE